MSQDMGIPAAVADWLNQRDIPAVTGWSGVERSSSAEPVVVVTVREYAALPGGFAHYLGERYNEQTAVWEECYGRKVELSLGLDVVSGEKGSEVQSQLLLEKLVSLLTLETPAGLQVNGITCGPTVWDEKARRLKREITAACIVWLQAVKAADTEFLDFELRGGWNI